MAAGINEIRQWLRLLYENPKYTHMIVVCDEFDWDDYPVYVSSNEDVHEREQHYREASMQRVMEVYSANVDMETQLGEMRAFHYE